MVTDVHVHLFDDPAHQIGGPFARDAARAHAGEVDLTTSWSAYRQAAPVGTRAIVFGGKARLAGLWVPDEAVAAFAAEHPDDVVPFASADPTQASWRDELEHAHEDLGLRGVKIMPMYAGFDPSDPAYDELWAYTERHGLPVLAHTGTTFVQDAPLELARPGLLDAVARAHPEQRLVLAHLGHPYEGECLATIRKHPHVYADVSALYYRPFQLWRALTLAAEYGVLDKLLFGSDYPFTTVDASIEGIRRIAAAQVGPFGPIDPDAIEALIDRDALALLALAG